MYLPGIQNPTDAIVVLSSLASEREGNAQFRKVFGDVEQEILSVLSFSFTGAFVMCKGEVERRLRSSPHLLPSSPHFIHNRYVTLIYSTWA